MPKLTIGMAHFDDYHGVYFTIQSIRLHHPEVIKDIEFVVIDNSPNSPHGKQVRQFVESNAIIGTAGAFYVPLVDPKGTSVSRDAIFAHASGDFVLVNDCHILYPSGSLKRLMDFYEQNPDTDNIYSGPLIYDSLAQVTTHFNDQWRGEMWGTWGSAWTDIYETEYFSTIQNPRDLPRVLPISLEMNAKSISSCGGIDIPENIPWAGHESVLEKAGFKKAGKNDDDKPFEIPGQGLGSFTCRRESWLGFNKYSRGFGGEELYIHEKYRQAGRKAICLPFLKWLHRFGRPEGAKYPLTRYGKVRNYVLEFNELGRDLDPIYTHFVATELMKESTWEYLIHDPISHENEDDEVGCSSCGTAKKLQKDALERTGGIDSVFDVVKGIKRDLDEHLPYLREIGSKCEHITEISKRKESFVAFAASRPKKFVSHNIEPSELSDYVEHVCTETEFERTTNHTHEIESIEQTDMLFIDTTHTYGTMMDELNKFAPSVKRFIIARGTKNNGEIGEDGGPGILVAMRDYMKKNPKWSVIHYTPNQYGLTVLGRLKKDKPKLPSKIEMAKNLAIAVKDHIKEGAENVAADLLEKRLEACSVCEFRNNDQCSVCGCFVSKKAKWKEQQCPLGKWTE